MMGEKGEVVRCRWRVEVEKTHIVGKRHVLVGHVRLAWPP